ncbi:hypothetical protein SAVIM338S_00296 [Streptomyces avidinii]
MFSARTNWCGGCPWRKTARLMGRWCARIERMTRRPVSGSFRERMMTSTRGSDASERSFNDSRRLTKGKAAPLGSTSSRCSSWYFR